MGWAMLYLFVFLKLPLLLAAWLLWWAIHEEPESDDGHKGDGGQRTRPHPPPSLPRRPRRGPHGGLAASPPPRVRPVRARARRTVS